MMRRGQLTGGRGRMAGCRRGFTLLELMVCMGIITLLALLLLGAVMRARHQARDVTCKSNLGQLWKAVNYYANASNDCLFVNTTSPLRISNTIYKQAQYSGWGHLYPKYLRDNRIFYCPGDPIRDIEWADYGWRHWETEDGEVRCSYGYRGRQGLVADPAVALTLSEIERNPQKIVGCDFYLPFAAPARVHHPSHTNVLRCNGSVVQVNRAIGFGPDDEDFQAALDALDL